MTTDFRYYDYNGDGFEVQRRKRILSVEVCYPRNDGERVNIVEVGLMDVRAADSIRVTYDFERNGWSVLQAAGWYRDQQHGDVMDWQEVAFLRAWARVPENEVEKT